MNTLDTRIQQALRAQAEQLTEQDLTPMQPPQGGAPRSGWNVPILIAAAVVLVTAGGTLAIRSATEHGHRTPAPAASRPASSTPPSPNSTAPSPSGTASSPSAAPTPSTSPSGQSSGPSQLPGGYALPLWPINEAGRGDHFGDAPTTALAFTRQYLGFTDITTVTSSRYDDQGAHIGVGYRNPAGQLATAAVLHLIQYTGGGPWEVVGSDDTTLTLEQPRYGSVVSSPMTVGGHITGVDENIRVVVRTQADGVVGRAPAVPAGGQASPWRTTVSFTGSGVLTVVASTGGHLQAVERFAIQGVHT
jgi:hypothetical protein